jgi:tetratricopeptide (TPR) repeat protein
VINQELAEAADRLWGEGDQAQALSLYQRIFQAAPNDIKALTVYANALISMRQASKALELLQSFSGSSDLAVSLASIKAKALLALGDQAQSLDLFHEVIKRNPNWADGWNDYGCALLQVGRSSEAAPCFSKALTIDLHHEKACLGLAKIQKNQGKLEQAKSTLFDFLRHSNSANIRRALIPILLKLNEKDEALTQAQTLTRALDATSDDYMLEARTLFSMGRLRNYIALLDTLGDRTWKGVSVKSIAIGALAESGHAEDVQLRLQQHLTENPSDANARLVEAREALRTGDFEKGWKSYAYRLRLPANQIHYGLSPNWAGEPLKNRDILVLGEQGVGDVCYFSRFLKPLLEDNPNSSLIIEPRIANLIEDQLPGLHIFSEPSHMNLAASARCKIALGSLPLLYGRSAEEIRSHFNPLKVGENAVQCMRDRIDKDSHYNYRVGISFIAGRQGDEYQRLKRTLPRSEVLRQFKDFPVTLVNLEHNEFPRQLIEEAELLGLQVLHYPDLTQDLRLLAATISALDLVVTSQQTNAHLSGALNKSGLVLLPPGCHFVYGNSDQSVWYPSLQLIRASKWGDWQDACKTLREILEQEITNG